MAKILNIRERVHQPYRDALIRTAGFAPGSLTSSSDLFITQGRDEGWTNLKTAAVLANDSSMIVLAARVLQWFRAPVIRRFDIEGNLVISNGDIGPQSSIDGWTFPNGAGQPAIGNAAGNFEDVYRLHWQCAEGLFWTLGAGEKDSLKSMPSMYFPYGGGLSGDIGAASDLAHLQNGVPSHHSILRVARAITITPRQLIRVNVNAVSYDDGGNGTLFGTSTTQGRNMLDPISNLNAADAVIKVVSMTIDGLLSRDVQ
jgi:hypothetical protein